MHLSMTDYLLWYSSPVLQAIIVACMFRRKLHREYRFFFSYTLFSVISASILFAVYRISYPAYYYAYLADLGLSILLSFAVLQEIFAHAFRPYSALRDLGMILFRWLSIVVLLVAVIWAISTPHTSNNGTVSDIFFLAERGLRLAQCGLVFFLILLSEYLGIRHRSFLFGITLGFGFFAIVNILVVTGVAQHWLVHKVLLRQINSGAYLVSVLMWLGYTVATLSKRPVLEADLLRSRNLNSALQDGRMPASQVSLLDRIDRSVERLLFPTRAQSRVKVVTLR